MSSQEISLVPLMTFSKSSSIQQDDPQRRQKMFYGRIQFILYLIWNMSCFIATGILVLQANELVAKQMKSHREYCCACYFISLNPEDYDQSKLARFDLSGCIPECMDCNYCNKRFNPATNAFNYTNDACPMLSNNPTLYNYKRPSGDFNWNWNDVTGCLRAEKNHLSYKMMLFWLKSYKAYGLMTLILCCLYAFILLSFAIIEFFVKASYGEYLKWISIYNILFSVISLYGLFKPFQYWHQKIQLQVDDMYVTCALAKNGKFTHYLMKYIIIAPVFIFIFVHIFVNNICCNIPICIDCCMNCCNHCCKRKRQRIRTMSTDTEPHEVNNTEKCRNAYEICFMYYVVIPLTIISFGYIFSETMQVIQARFNDDLNSSHVKTKYTIAIIVLIIRAICDLYIWFLFCYNNALNLSCKLNVKTCDCVCDLCVCGYCDRRTCISVSLSIVVTVALIVIPLIVKN